MAISDSVASPGQYTPTSDELSLEAGIRLACDAVLAAGTIKAQVAAWTHLKELHAQRSPEMVAYLELARGLRP